MDCVHIRRHGCTVFVFVTTPRQQASSPKKPIKQKNSSDAAENLCWVHRFLHHISASCSKTHLFTLMIRRKKAASVEAHQPSASDLCHFYVSYQAVLMLLKPCGALSCARWKTPGDLSKKREEKRKKKIKNIEHSWEIVWDGSCWSWSKTVCFIDWQAVF